MKSILIINLELENRNQNGKFEARNSKPIEANLTEEETQRCNVACDPVDAVANDALSRCIFNGALGRLSCHAALSAVTR